MSDIVGALTNQAFKVRISRSLIMNLDRYTTKFHVK